MVFRYLVLTYLRLHFLEVVADAACFFLAVAAETAVDAVVAASRYVVAAAHAVAAAVVVDAAVAAANYFSSES
jgi:hypothetical protein